MRQSPQYLKQMLSPKDLQEESNIIAYSETLVKKKRGAQSLNVLCYIRIVVPLWVLRVIQPLALSTHNHRMINDNFQPAII